MSPHIATEEEKDSEIARRWLAPALSQIYEMTIVSNFGKDSYLVFHHSGMFSLPEKGSYQLFLDTIAQKLEEEQKQHWYHAFSKEI